jgi:predicted transcriptional regulator of viral defense system
MNKKTRGFLKDILRSDQTVLSFKELSMWWKTEGKTARSRLHYYVKTGELYPIRRGLYAKDKNYDRFELANKIFTPSYISFETVLLQSGIIFQYYSQIFVACPISRTLEIDGQKYVFRKIKAVILVNSAGVERKGNYYMACPERAFLDMLYLHKDYYFDYVGSLNWDKVHEILAAVYGDHKRMKKVVAQHYATFLSEYIQ